MKKISMVGLLFSAIFSLSPFLGAASFRIKVIPYYNQQENQIEIYGYAAYKRIGGVMNIGAGRFEIFPSNGKSTGLKGKLFFNTKSGRWEAKPINASSLSDGEYYCLASIKNKGTKVERRVYFFIRRRK